MRAKDKTYWEEVPEELYNQSIFKTLDFKKTKPRLITEVILLLGIIACLQLLHIDAENSPIWLIWFIRIFGYTIVLDATGR